jgi:5-methylcytosine-specific restriction endonuclease McrA
MPEYRCTEHGRQVLQAAQRRYARTDHGRRARSESNQRWRQSPHNRERERRSSRQYREQQRGIPSQMPLGYEDLVFGIFDHRCAACSASGKLVLDHHRPLQMGYALLHNAVPLCVRCNARKNRKPPEEFYDGWKLTEIAVLLLETREAFEARFGSRVSAC